MSELKLILVTKLLPNPHRDLKHYPFKKNKLEALSRSVDETGGIWEGVIVRAKGRDYELAFGHHRVEVAKRKNIAKIPVVIKSLTDEEMLKYMDNENKEDYNSDFLTALEVWEGTVRYKSGPDRVQNSQPLDIAGFLGWTRKSSAKLGYRMDHTAMACNAAYKLIQGGYKDRTDFIDMSTFAAKEISQREVTRIEQLDKIAAKTNQPKVEVDKAKKAIAKAGKVIARKVREQDIKQKEIKTELDIEAHRQAGKVKIKSSPLFAQFGKNLVATVKKMLDEDSSGMKLAEIVKVVNTITMEEDARIIRNLQFELMEVKTRADNWHKKLTPTKEKVVSLLSITNQKGDQ